MSQISDCPINKSVVLSFDAKEGQQSTFPLEQNLDSLISSMLAGVNLEYTKPISVVPAGSTKDLLAPFVKSNTSDVSIIPPTVEQPAAPVTAPVAVTVPAQPSVAAAPVESPVAGTAPFNPTPIVLPPTPNQPSPNVTVPTPLISPVVNTEKFANNTYNETRSNNRAAMISNIIAVFFLLIIIYLIAVKLGWCRYN